MVIKTTIKEHVIMTVKTAEQISDQIVAAFPKKVKVLWFLKLLNINEQI